MEISVIVPTYRRPALLKKCLEALLKQKFDKDQYEVIVVSDGPDIDTRLLVNSIVKNRAASLRFLSLPVKKGPAAARNYGWLNAKGKIIVFTDDDCLPDRNWLSEIASNLNPNTEEAVTGKVIVPRSKRPTDYEQNTAGLETADFVTANCACTRSALLKTGGFDERFPLAWREDSDLEFKLISEGVPVRRIESAIVVHPVRAVKWGVSIKEQKKTQYNALLYKKYPALYRKKIQAIPPLLYYGIVIAFAGMIAGILLRSYWLGIAGFYAWIFLTFNFIVKRLYNTRLSARHIAEMVATSFIIPFISIYWQWYGAFKYRVFFP
ncbi:MAG TPA: glycosyltransferase [Mucilaginibacter sp.]|nr:glycosyltransferase [Mucilaginibacter sp.]